MKTYSQFKKDLEEGFTVKLIKRGLSIKNFGGGEKSSKIGADKYSISNTKTREEVGSASRWKNSDLQVKMKDGSGFNIIGPTTRDPQKEINRHVKFERKAKKMLGK